MTPAPGTDSAGIVDGGGGVDAQVFHHQGFAVSKAELRHLEEKGQRIRRSAGGELHELRRSTPEEKKAQFDNLRAFQARGADRVDEALDRLKKVAAQGGNIFGEFMKTVRCASPGQIVGALYEVGGQYRRAM